VFTQTFPADLAEAMSASDALLAGPFPEDFFAELAVEEELLAAGAAIVFVAAGFAAGAAIVFDSAGFELSAGAEPDAAAVPESAFFFFDFLVEVVSEAIASDLAGVVLVDAAELSLAAASAFLDFFDFFLVVVSEDV